MNLQIADGWIQTNQNNILDRLESGEKLLAALNDLFGIYAIGVYSKQYKNVDPKDEDFKEFLSNGTWYEESK